MQTPPPRPLPSRQRGIALLEALLAFLVLSIGMLALSRLQNGLRAGAESARERTEAVRLAQRDIESLRTFTGMAGWNAIADATANVTPADGTTDYTLERRVQTVAGLALKTVQVTLHWTDRHGAAQQLQLHTMVAGQDAALSAALSLPRPLLSPP